MYHIHVGESYEGGNFRELVEKWHFAEKTFMRLLARTTYCQSSLQTIMEKTFAERHRTVEFVKVFSLESFPLYSICTYMYIYIQLNVR